MVARSPHVVAHMGYLWMRKGAPSSEVDRQQEETSLLGEERYLLVAEEQGKLFAGYQTECLMMVAGLVEVSD
jgi:hypothetical protein